MDAPPAPRRFAGSRLADFVVEGRTGRRQSQPGYYGCNSAVFDVRPKHGAESMLALKVLYNVEEVHRVSARRHARAPFPVSTRRLRCHQSRCLGIRRRPAQPWRAHHQRPARPRRAARTCRPSSPRNAAHATASRSYPRAPRSPERLWRTRPLPVPQTLAVGPPIQVHAPAAAPPAPPAPEHDRVRAPCGMRPPPCRRSSAPAPRRSSERPRRARGTAWPLCRGGSARHATSTMRRALDHDAPVRT